MAMAENRTMEFLRVLVGGEFLADVRQQHLPGSPLPRASHADAREILPLSQSRREHAQGTGAPLGPGIIPGFSKQGEHKALADIQESIRELEYYRRQLFAAAYQQS
jgi:hypothetical protein